MSPTVVPHFYTRVKEIRPKAQVYVKKFSKPVTILIVPSTGLLLKLDIVSVVQ